ncbi:hypothetical protein SLOPH_1109 [Spraguea lophii 42_110]|uniref:Uncharacterized protein n=1 Tax=Spraguea lophii (strain 42_110) TaxID=1358809 RepID=S7W6W6_SPRLO|nr:hypothetical protein SLOPH_1109 [Spraguea lophii 42_110]
MISRKFLLQNIGLLAHSSILLNINRSAPRFFQIMIFLYCMRILTAFAEIKRENSLLRQNYNTTDKKSLYDDDFEALKIRLNNFCDEVTDEHNGPIKTIQHLKPGMSKKYIQLKNHDVKEYLSKIMLFVQSFISYMKYLENDFAPLKEKLDKENFKFVTDFEEVNSMMLHGYYKIKNVCITAQLEIEDGCDIDNSSSQYLFIDIVDDIFQLGLIYIKAKRIEMEICNLNYIVNNREKLFNVFERRNSKNKKRRITLDCEEFEVLKKEHYALIEKSDESFLQKIDKNRKIINCEFAEICNLGEVLKTQIKKEENIIQHTYLIEESKLYEKSSNVLDNMKDDQMYLEDTCNFSIDKSLKDQLYDEATRISMEIPEIDYATNTSVIIHNENSSSSNLNTTERDDNLSVSIRNSMEIKAEISYDTSSNNIKYEHHCNDHNFQAKLCKDYIKEEELKITEYGNEIKNISHTKHWRPIKKAEIDFDKISIIESDIPILETGTSIRINDLYGSDLSIYSIESNDEEATTKSCRFCSNRKLMAIPLALLCILFLFCVIKACLS